MKKASWIVLAIGISLLFWLFTVLKEEREREEGPIIAEHTCPICRPVAEKCEPKIETKVITETVAVPQYYTDPTLQERLATCMGERDELKGEIGAWKLSYEDLKNKCN